MTGPAAPPRPARRVRARASCRLVAAAAALSLVVLAACGSSDAPTPAADGAVAATTTTTSTAATAPTPAPAPAVGGQPLPPAPALPPAVDEGPEPTALTIDSLDVVAAPVRAVGVEENGEMEIPGATEVGWYRFGARPGEAGSTVLAAHIANDGVDGVFRHLDDLEAGDTVRVGQGDGSTAAYVVTDVTQVPKAELPADVWAREGPARLVLITCGGEFDRAAGHYEDNVVAYARPA